MIEEVYTELPEQEPQVPEQQDPPSKAKKLYNNLISDGYTKENIGSEDEFIKALSNRETAKKIYTNLITDGYTTDNLGSEDEFLTTFSPLKKKVGSTSYVQSIPVSESETQSTSNQKTNKEDSFFGYLKSTLEKGSLETKNILNKREKFFGVDPFELDESGRPKMGKMGKTAYDFDKHKEIAKLRQENRGGYLWNKILRGMGSVLTASGDLIMNIQTSVLPESVIGGSKEQAMKQWREEVEPVTRDFFEKRLGDKTVTQEQEDKYNKEFLTSAVGGLAESLPAILSPKGTKAISLIFQAQDNALQSINSTQEGRALPESTKTIFSLGTGIAHGILEKYGIDKILGKQSSVISRKIAGKVFSDLIEKTDIPITKEIFEQALDNYSKSAKQQLLDATRKLGQAGAVEFFTGSLQEGATIFAESLVNKSAGQDIFQPKSWGEMAGRVVKSGAQEAVGGLILGGATVPFSKVDNYISDKVANAKSTEDIESLKLEISDAISKNGEIDEQSSSEIMNLISDYQRVNSKIPDTVPDRKFAADKIIERENLEAEIDKKISEKELVDVAFQPEIQTEIDLLQRKIDEINDQVVNGRAELELPKQQNLITEISSEEVKRQMQPITDKMADIEREFENNGIDIDRDYDNEIIVTNKKTGEMMDVEEIPENLIPLLAAYEKQTMKLGDFSEQDFISSLTESRKRIKGEDTQFEEIKPQISEAVRTEINQPVSEIAEISEGQGTKETVSEGTIGVGQGKPEATTTVLSEREVVPAEKPMEGKEVELPVTKSGLTEAEREKLIQDREKKTAIPEKDKETQDILNDISKYNKLPNGRLGKLKPEGLKSLNKIREKVRSFNDKHGTNYSFDDRSGKLYDKNKKGLTGAVKGKNVYDPDSGIDRSGKTLRERDKDVIDAFDQLMEVGALPTGYGTDGRRMSSSQLDATVQDILDGVPSRRANNYLDALEKMVREDDFDFSQPDFPQTNKISLSDIVGIEKETATEPMTEQQIDKWLEDESKMTREDERLFDNIENLINEYEIENGFEREVEQSPATTKTTISAETQQNEKSGSTAAESTRTDNESGKVDSTESENTGVGEGAPPNEPTNEKASTAFEEQKRTRFSHKGIQEVATEYGLDDVTSRERVSDLELFRRADETISKWVSEGSYRRNINDLLQRSKEGEILPTPEQNIIIAQHIAQLRGAAEKARKEFGVNSKEYNDALSELQDVSSVGAKIRSDIGAALRVPNLSRTYMQTLEDAMVTKMDAVGADVLTESQKREVEEQFEKIKIEKERFETLYNEAVTKNNELAAENELLKIQKDKKTVFGVKMDYKAHRQSLKEQLKNEVEKYKQEGNKMGISSDGGMKSFEISVKMAEIIMKIVKSHVDEVGAKLADVTKRTFEDVRDLFEGITENDIRDVIAGVYSKKEKTLTQLQADMKDVQAEAKLLNELNRVMQGVPKNEKQEKEKNRKLFELKKQIDALKKESGLDQYSDEAKIKRAILSIKRQEEKIRQRINSKDYSKEEKKKGVFDNPEFKRKYPDLYKKLLDAYTAKEEAQHEFDIALAKDEYERMSKFGKALDFGDKALNTTKKLVTGIDLSAMGIQGFFAILRRPVVGVIALKESFLDLASKKRFERQIAEIHNSEIYDLMQKSGLDITEPKSLLAKEKEEIFSGQTLDINVKYKGRSYKIIEPLFAPFERAFTSLGNNLRVVAFATISEKYIKEGYTFENNPKLFKDLAKMLNTETGRGEQNEYLQRASELVTKGIWSPRLMASRMNLLGISDAIALITGRKAGTKGYYSQLDKKVRTESLKSTGQFMLSVYALSYLAAYALGGELDDEPDSSTFMDIKVGDKSYNLTGGFSQYVKLIAQSVRGGRKIEGEFREFKGEKSVLTNLGHFMRGKLTPASGVVADVLSGMRDYSNKPVTVSDEITKLTIPLSLRDTKNQMEKDGTSAIFTHILPSFVGINVKDKRDYETNDLSVKEFKFLYDKGVRLPQTLQENLKVENSKGEEIKVSDADFEKFKNEKNKIIQGYVKKIMDKGYPKMVNGFPKIVPAKELDTEELQDAMDRYSRKATKQAKEKIFGVKQKSIEDKISDKVLESAIKGGERQ